jgi:exonuclease VII large subunit
MADDKRAAARPTVAQDKADHQAAVSAHGHHDAPHAAPASRGEPVHSPMLDRDRERLAELRAKLPPVPEHRTPEEEEEMHILERRLEKAAQAEWAKQDVRVLELQQNDHRTPEEEAELARLVREIDRQDRAVKRAEGVKP